MGFDDEIQFAQEVFDLLGTFYFNRSGWMAQLDMHGRIIISHTATGQGGSYGKGKWEVGSREWGGDGWDDGKEGLSEWLLCENEFVFGEGNPLVER